MMMPKWIPDILAGHHFRPLVKFRQSSQELDAKLPGITKANDALEESLQSIEDIGAFLNATANFLKYADEAIDIAKSLAA
jgi:hypothetical protein